MFPGWQCDGGLCCEISGGLSTLKGWMEIQLKHAWEGAILIDIGFFGNWILDAQSGLWDHGVFASYKVM